jgi:hypothetical protein
MPAPEPASFGLLRLMQAAQPCIERQTGRTGRHAAQLQRNHPARRRRPLPCPVAGSRVKRGDGDGTAGAPAGVSVSSATLLRNLTSKNNMGPRRTAISGNFLGPEPSLLGRNKAQRELKRPLLAAGCSGRCFVFPPNRFPGWRTGEGGAASARGLIAGAQDLGAAIDVD